MRLRLGRVEKFIIRRVFEKVSGTYYNGHNEK